VQMKDIISFPGLNLSFEINPILFTIFGIKIYLYAFCMVSAIAISVVLCCKCKPKFDIKDDFLFGTFIYAIIFGIIGARLYYVMFNLKYYFSNPINILRIRDGGLAIYGALIAGAIVIIYRCQKYQVKLLDIFDRVVPFVALRTINWQMGKLF